MLYVVQVHCELRKSHPPHPQEELPCTHCPQRAAMTGQAGVLLCPFPRSVPRPPAQGGSPTRPSRRAPVRWCPDPLQGEVPHLPRPSHPNSHFLPCPRSPEGLPSAQPPTALPPLPAPRAQGAGWFPFARPGSAASLRAGSYPDRVLGGNRP